MIKIEIKNRWTGSIIFSYEKENNSIAETIKEYIRQEVVVNGKYRANLTDADLTRANLTRANLTDADLTRANLTDADLTRANLTRANLTDADLTDADLTRANLTRANLTDADLTRANLTRANLTRANLTVFKYDLWAKLLMQKSEIQGLKDKIKSGQVDGSCYEGECCCFVGTLANVKGVKYTDLLVKPMAGSPIERWFTQISSGMTPENNGVVKLTLEWIEEFESLLK